MSKAHNQKRLFLQFGTIGQPMRTVEVEYKEVLLDHHKQGLTYTATGYGSKIPTQYMVKYNNRWHRVYCRIYSNSGSLYIISGGEQVRVTEYN